jgi:Asp-tRNA(Asn)/Glu-tRNA(Gln) amidotransferase A subunit family amidase
MDSRDAKRGPMSDAATPGWIVDRMRSNLSAAGIPIAERDLERIRELGLFWTALAFDALERDIPAGEVPDHVGGIDGGVSSDAETLPPSGAMAAAPADSIAGLAPRIRAREISAVELTEQALARIAARDPELNAFQLVLAEPALAAARAADREIAAGRHRGPLHGVPIAVKDLLDVAGTPTTVGSKIHAGRVRDVDAAAVERLRAAGAIIIGKTRLAEFAYSPGSNNAHFGPTRNPHDRSRDTGGSSSGSGAAVGGGLVVAALGSDTGGSIRIPGSLCGIVGLKPTFGRVSLRGASPLSWSLDHIGPMSRTVLDAALLLESIAGHDAGDPRTRAIPVPAYGAAIGGGAQGLRIGVLGDDGENASLAALDAYPAWRAGLERLARAGATLVPVDLPVLATMRVVNGALLGMEAAAHHAPTLRERSADYGEFARLRLLTAFAYSPGAYLRAQQARADCRRRFAAGCAGIDLLSTPTMPGPAPPLGTPAPTRFTAPFNLLGWPAITVPTGDVQGMPIGLQLIGRPWDEATVLRAARVIEGALGAA